MSDRAYLTRADAHRDLNAYITLDRAGGTGRAAQRADAVLAAGTTMGVSAALRWW